MKFLKPFVLFLAAVFATEVAVGRSASARRSLSPDVDEQRKIILPGTVRAAATRSRFDTSSKLSSDALETSSDSEDAASSTSSVASVKKGARLFSVGFISTRPAFYRLFAPQDDADDDYARDEEEAAAANFASSFLDEVTQEIDDNNIIFESENIVGEQKTPFDNEISIAASSFLQMRAVWKISEIMNRASSSSGKADTIFNTTSVSNNTVDASNNITSSNSTNIGIEWSAARVNSTFNLTEVHHRQEVSAAGNLSSASDVLTDSKLIDSKLTSTAVGNAEAFVGSTMNVSNLESEVASNGKLDASDTMQLARTSSSESAADLKEDILSLKQQTQLSDKIGQNASSANVNASENNSRGGGGVWGLRLLSRLVSSSSQPSPASSSISSSLATDLNNIKDDDAVEEEVGEIIEQLIQEEEPEPDQKNIQEGDDLTTADVILRKSNLTSGAIDAKSDFNSTIGIKFDFEMVDTAAESVRGGEEQLASEPNLETVSIIDSDAIPNLDVADSLDSIPNLDEIPDLDAISVDADSIQDIPNANNDDLSNIPDIDFNSIPDIDFVSSDSDENDDNSDNDDDDDTQFSLLRSRGDDSTSGDDIVGSAFFRFPASLQFDFNASSETIYDFQLCDNLKIALNSTYSSRLQKLSKDGVILFEEWLPCSTRPADRIADLSYNFRVGWLEERTPPERLAAVYDEIVSIFSDQALEKTFFQTTQARYPSLVEALEFAEGGNEDDEDDIYPFAWRARRADAAGAGAMSAFGALAVLALKMVMLD